MPIMLASLSIPVHENLLCKRAYMHMYMLGVINFDQSSYNAYISKVFISTGLKCYLSASDRTEEQYDFKQTWFMIVRYPEYGFILSGLSANVCSSD